MFQLFTRKQPLVSVRETRSTSGTVLESGSQEQEPAPIKSFTNGTARSRHLERGAHLRRYWIRGAMGLFVPIAVTIYWFVVWYIYLIPQPAGSPIEFGHSGGRWVFYSWFIIGIFGMNLSKYGLTGIEAGMMMDPRWAAKNAMQVMMHAEHSWAGPSGWLKSIKHLFVRGEKRPEPPTPLWTLLAFLSILPCIAIPLTGLCYELKEGYHPTGTHPNVTGLRQDDINSISYSGIAEGLWKTGTNASLPRLGVIYTKSDVTRSDFPYLADFPNYLPEDDGVEDVFITAQADVPISGESWGLRLSYNCSVVNKASDFTILSQRWNVTITETGNWYYPNETGTINSQINIRNDTGGAGHTYRFNYFAILEEGISVWPPLEYNDDNVLEYADPALKEESAQSNDTFIDDCYFWDHGNEGPERRYPGMDVETIYEAALWQDLENWTDIDMDNVTFNRNLDANLTDLYDAWLETMGWSWPAVGVRCAVRSEVGWATIDGRSSTYSDFDRSNTPVPDTDTCMPRMDVSAPAGVIDSSTLEYDTGEWVDNLFRSVNSPIPASAQIGFKYNSTSATTNTSATSTNGTSSAPLSNSTNTTTPHIDLSEKVLQTTYLQANDLRHSLLRTYPAYVSEMMFNGGFGFAEDDGLKSINYVNTNATEFIERNLFEKGDILQFWVPGALFIVWSVGMVSLTLIYGFRRRWSATLDSYSVLRFGADFAESIRNSPEFGINMSFEECYLLCDLPGLIGDANVGFEPGHITLVKDARADKTKLYM